MGQPRTMLLFDPSIVPHSWNERMEPGEYAVLYSSYESSPDNPSGAPFCIVFSHPGEAEEHAKHEVQRVSTLRCRIYGDAGLGAPPIRKIRGTDHRGEGEMSARFRRWCGSVLFFGSLGLFVLDWRHDFGLVWPATLGIRALPVGLVLLITEAVIVFGSSRKGARRQHPAA